MVKLKDIVTMSSATPFFLPPDKATFKYHDRSKIEGEYFDGGFPALDLEDLLTGTWGLVCTGITGSGVCITDSGVCITGSEISITGSGG